ncbi:hypothetical protein SLEP1_g60093, partial [Rubroshorea leprosula]
MENYRAFPDSGNLSSKVVAVAVGEAHTLALIDDQKNITYGDPSLGDHPVDEISYRIFPSDSTYTSRIYSNSNGSSFSPMLVKMCLRSTTETNSVDSLSRTLNASRSWQSEGLGFMCFAMRFKKRGKTKGTINFSSEIMNLSCAWVEFLPKRAHEDPQLGRGDLPIPSVSKRVKRNPSLNALLSDICIGTSAAPTYLPPHYFTTKNTTSSSTEEDIREFNLIDGSVAANNPTLVAMEEAKKEMTEVGGGSPPCHYTTRFFVISLGTGSNRSTKDKHSAKEAAKWNLFGWLRRIVEVFTQASADMVDYHISVVLKMLQSEDNYLRIQDDTLSGVLGSIDIAKKKNLDDLVEVGEKLLKKPVSKVNMETGLIEPCGQGSNEEALK